MWDRRVKEAGVCSSLFRRWKRFGNVPSSVARKEGNTERKREKKNLYYRHSFYWEGGEVQGKPNSRRSNIEGKKKPCKGWWEMGALKLNTEPGRRDLSFS